MKKILAVMLSFVFAFTVFGITGCGNNSNDANFSEEYIAFADAVDVDFTKEVQKTISEFGDDEALGMRTSGSPAEKETCDYLEGVMKDIGLQNVTVDEATVDGWTFKGANITYIDVDGNEVKADLAGYQTTIQADNEEVEIVYVNRGTAEDYEGKDVNGKLVLFEVNQEDDWWINYPAYQAKVKGAKCAIAMRELAEMGDGTDDRIGVQDVCGSADAPALAISNKDCKAIKAAIEASGKDSIKVKFNADSKVTENTKTHNLYGEIPGETDETIFVFSHMDGYFHSTYDDAQGCAVSLAQAKALIDSGYTPSKTIRFCIHGSEEWGREGSEYDWSTGAYEEIANNHPEWKDGAIAIVNNDGGYAVQDEINNGVMTSIELKDFAKESMDSVVGDLSGEWQYNNLTTYTEDFYWTRVGIPAISAGTMEETTYDNIGYHTNYDSFDAQPLNEEDLATTTKAYGKVIIDLDALDVRPLNFSARIKNFEESLNDDAKEQFADVISEANEAAEALQAKMDEVEAADDKEAALEINKQTQEVYVALQDALLGLDLINVEAIVKHDMYEDNIDNLDAAIEALEAGNIQEAYDEYLSSVDWSWYRMYFDEETCDHMKTQLFEKRDDTWGKDLIKYPHADTDAVVVSLGEKYDDADADVSEDIEALKTIRAKQQTYLEKTYASELKGLKKAVSLMSKYAK